MFSISVIIPVYNEEKDLEKRISSIQGRLAEGKLTTKEYWKKGKGVIDNKKALRA